MLLLLSFDYVQTVSNGLLKHAKVNEEDRVQKSVDFAMCVTFCFFDLLLLLFWLLRVHSWVLQHLCEHIHTCVCCCTWQRWISHRFISFSVCGMCGYLPSCHAKLSECINQHLLVELVNTCEHSSYLKKQCCFCLLKFVCINQGLLTELVTILLFNRFSLKSFKTVWMH